MNSKIKSLFENTIEQYVLWRKSANWHEKYKWDILPKLNGELSARLPVTPSNVSDILSLYKETNPADGPWVVFYFFARVKKIIDDGQPDQAAQVFNLIFENNINDAYKLYKSATNSPLSTNAIGYLLAGFNPSEFPLYRGEFFAGIKEYLNLPEPHGIAERYKIYKDVALELGNNTIKYLQNHEQDLYEYHKDFPAISGQDFLYFLYFGSDKKRILELVSDFVIDADNSSLKTKKYKIQYNGCRVNVSFGQGALAKVPWIGFNLPNHISAVNILYYKDQRKLVLAYGVLEEHEPSITWNIKNQTINAHYLGKFEPTRYGKSYYINEYNPHDLPESIIDDVNSALEEYKRQASGNSNGIIELVKRFIEHSDDRGKTRSDFNGEYRTLKYRAWFGTSDKTYLKNPWIVFGKDNNERGSKWDDNRIIVVYMMEQKKILLIYKWEDSNGRRRGINNDRASAEVVEGGSYWPDWYARGVYNIDEITTKFAQDFESLADEYEALNNPEDNKTGESTMDSDISLNTILYGPPGTGKTYQALNSYAYDLLSHQAGQIKTVEEVLAERLKDLTWWQVTALALHQANKPTKVAALSLSPTISSYAKFVKNRTTSIKPTLWSTLQERSDEDSSKTAYKVAGSEYFIKNDQSEWSLTESGKSLVAETLSEIDLNAEAETGTDWHKFLRTITFHQSYSYEEFIEGIRPVINPDEQTGQISYEIKDGIFKEMCTVAHRDPTNKYLLIIDEINRGNISKVFGELITLLEDDKREVLEVQLPYSQTLFTVPKNLYVLGTMNTADRSIALLDIALRRRFNFVEIMPDYTRIDKDIAGVKIKKLLLIINERLEIMTDRDHQIGHSYFMNSQTKEDLHSAWYNKIMPLLSEYFYNDWERLIDVVGKYNTDLQTGFIDGKSVKDIQKLFRKDTEYSEVKVGNLHKYNIDQLPKALKAIYEEDAQTD